MKFELCVLRSRFVDFYFYFFKFIRVVLVLYLEVSVANISIHKR
jgi:hypothetical protein